MELNSVQQPVNNSKGRILTSKWVQWAVIAVAAIIVVGAVAKAVGPLRTERAIKGKQYQALFLTNGQVYFGKLSGVTKDYVKLTDIYYLQVQQTVQPGSNDTNKQPQVSLAKLGSELHGPEDVMHISRDQVLFWENLKDDSKVVSAIKDHKSK